MLIRVSIVVKTETSFNCVRREQYHYMFISL